MPPIGNKQVPLTPSAPFAMPAQSLGSPDVTVRPAARRGVSLDEQGLLPLGVQRPLELAYTQITAPVTVSGTTDGTATVVVTADQINLDGFTPVIVEFWSCSLQLGAAAGADCSLILFDAAGGAAAAALTSVWYAQKDATITANRGITGCHTMSRLTPAAGTHQFSIRGERFQAVNAVVVAGTGTGGGAGNAPAFIRITRAT